MTGEQRLADALDRIGRNSYLPSRAARALGFANDASSAGRALAGARWQAEQAPEEFLRHNCGATDPLGYCMEAYHSLT